MNRTLYRDTRWRLLVPIVGGAVFGFILAACTLGLGSGAGPALELPPIERSDLNAIELRRSEIFRDVAPSVVNISTSGRVRSFFFSNPTEVPQGTGTGFVWDRSGHVVTNYHVIQRASSAKVTLADDTTYDAKLVGFYPDKDIAVLKIDAPRAKLRPVKLGRSDNLVIGQTALAIGNPYGYKHTLTSGIVSATGREILSPNKRVIIDVIQIDAAINPGNSGGPLLDSSGKLIGMNTAIFSPSMTNAGIGFAVPVDVIDKVVPQLIEHGQVKRPLHPVLGIYPIPDERTRRAGIRGVAIQDVDPDGGAAKAGMRGLRENYVDVIVKVDDQPVSHLGELTYYLEKRKPGDVVEVHYVRLDLDSGRGREAKGRVVLEQPE